MHRDFFKENLPVMRKERAAKKTRNIWRPKRRRATGEGKVFDAVWAARAHNCQICGRPIMVRRPLCFAHQWAKGTHGAERLDPSNIVLVCSEKCHAAVDARRHSLPWPKICKR